MVIAAINTKDKIFHYPDCICSKRIKPEHTIYFCSKDDARLCGFKHCKQCSRIIQYYKESKRDIDNFISSHNLKVYFDDDTMFIENTFSAWKIIIQNSGYRPVLYHANTESYNKLEKKDGHIIHHYHLQKYLGKQDILSMLKYIIEHDEWKMNNSNSYKSLPKTTKKQRKEYNKAKKNAMRIKTRNIYNLIDRLSYENKVE